MNDTFIMLEIAVTVFFILCIYHSIKRGKNYLVELIVISMYGLLLEIIGIAISRSYIYGDFTVKILEAPVAVALGWGVIIYVSMATVDRLEVAQKVRPFIVALLALNIDLSMDAIAFREGLWTWGGGNGFWFNVPASNFIGWFVVAFSFAYFIYYLRKKERLSLFYPILAMILSLIVLVIVEIIEVFWLLPNVKNQLVIFSLITIVMIISLIYVILKKGKIKKDNEIDWIGSLIPLGFHLYFLVLLLVRDYRTPALIVVSITMTIIGAYVHFLPSLFVLKAKFKAKKFS